MVFASIPSVAVGGDGLRSPGQQCLYVYTTIVHMFLFLTLCSKSFLAAYCMLYTYLTQWCLCGHNNNLYSYIFITSFLLPIVYLYSCYIHTSSALMVFVWTPTFYNIFLICPHWCPPFSVQLLLSVSVVSWEG